MAYVACEGEEAGFLRGTHCPKNKTKNHVSSAATQLLGSIHQLPDLFPRGWDDLLLIHCRHFDAARQVVSKEPAFESAPAPFPSQHDPQADDNVAQRFDRDLLGQSVHEALNLVIPDLRKAHLSEVRDQLDRKS